MTQTPVSMLLRGHTLTPPLLLAPMAGITHSAFRRLLADFGGYGALFTEMLSSKSLLKEDLNRSPFTMRRECEGRVFYQLRISQSEPIEQIIERLSTIDPFGIDINLGCPAPAIRRLNSGTALFDNFDALRELLERARASWDGILSVKCRLGAEEPGWEERFLERLKLFEQIGIDFLTVHPRFAGEKLKRKARWHLLKWIVASTSLPVIANGDITDRTTACDLVYSSGCCAAMIGRFAVVKPWVFAPHNLSVDHAEIWDRLFEYVCADFTPEKAIGRMKEFSAYFARNFFFGHQFFTSCQSASTLPELRERAQRFLSGKPRLVLQPSVDGI